MAQNQPTMSTLPRFKKEVPFIKFTKSKVAEGAIGPFGEVRVFEVADEILPVYISAPDGSAVMDMTGRNPFVRYGNDATAITLTGDGVEFGKGQKLKSWNAEVVKELIAALSKDRKKARAAMLLRSALHTSYPVAVAGMKSSKQSAQSESVPAFLAASYSKAAKNKRMGAAIKKGTSAFTQPNFWTCTTSFVTETVTRTITDVTEVIKTELEQYQECYDREVSKKPCSEVAFGLGAGPCAAAKCVLEGYVDIVVGFVEVVVGVVTEEVVRTVVTCNPREAKIIKEWLNPWFIDQPQRVSGVAIGNVSSAADAPFNLEDVTKALEFLKGITDFLGPFGKCFLDAKWSFAEINTQIEFGGKDLAIPYGIKVCISSACAKKLTVQETSSYQILNEQIQSRFPTAAVSISTYPDPTRGPFGFCGTAANTAQRILRYPCCLVEVNQLINPVAEYQFTSEQFIRGMNTTVRNGSNQHGWSLIETETRMGTHGLCNCDDPYINTLGASFPLQGDERATVHPNKKGYREVYRNPVASNITDAFDNFVVQRKGGIFLAILFGIESDAIPAACPTSTIYGILPGLIAPYQNPNFDKILVLKDFLKDTAVRNAISKNDLTRLKTLPTFKTLQSRRAEVEKIVQKINRKPSKNPVKPVSVKLPQTLVKQRTVSRETLKSTEYKKIINKAKSKPFKPKLQNETDETDNLFNRRREF